MGEVFLGVGDSPAPQSPAHDQIPTSNLQVTSPVLPSPNAPRCGGAEAGSGVWGDLRATLGAPGIGREPGRAELAPEAGAGAMAGDSPATCLADG